MQCSQSLLRLMVLGEMLVFYELSVGKHFINTHHQEHVPLAVASTRARRGSQPGRAAYCVTDDARHQMNT